MQNLPTKKMSFIYLKFCNYLNIKYTDSFINQLTEYDIKQSTINSFNANSDLLNKMLSIERELLLQLARVEEVIEESALKLEPAVLSTFAFTLCSTFSTFYQTVSVNNASSEELKLFRLKLVSFYKDAMLDLLNTLGLVPIEKV